MVKCATCKEKLEETFLKKPLGTAVKEKGKVKWICSKCQSSGDAS